MLSTGGARVSWVIHRGVVCFIGSGDSRNSGVRLDNMIESIMDGPRTDVAGDVEQARLRGQFDELDECCAKQRAAEVGVIIAIARLIDSYEVTTEAVYDGMEAVINPGSAGTGGVGEFLALEIGARMGIGSRRALELIADVLDVSQRHRSTWQAFLQQEISWRIAAQIAQRCSNLSLQQAEEVDARIAPLLGDASWMTLARNLTRQIAKVDPDAMRRERMKKKSWRGVWIDGFDGGEAKIGGQLAGEDAAALDHVLNQIAATLPDPEPIVDPKTGEIFEHRARDAKRAAALGILARSAYGQESLATHTLVVHVDARDVISQQHEAETADTEMQRGSAQVFDVAGRCAPGGGVATVEQWGDVLVEDLPEFLRNSRVVVRPIIDPATIQPTDAYRAPESMRFAVQQRNPNDVFPFGTRPARLCDLDHTVPFEDDVQGQTRPDNLAPLSRRHHRAKTHGGWKLQQPQEGAFYWESPTGARFLVTADGTKRLDRHLPMIC